MERIEILKKATEVLKEKTGLVLRRQGSNLKEKKIDYTIEIYPPNDAHKKLNYLIQVKRRISNATLSETAILAKSNAERFVLVAEYISPSQTEKLRKLDIPFFDTAGNAYFNESGLYVLVTGNKLKEKQERQISIFSENGIKLVLHLLLEPGLESSDYRTIEKETGVPRSTIGRILKDLERAGFLIRRSNRERFLIRKSDLLKRWVENYGEKLRVKLDPVRYHSSKFEGRWWNDLDLAEYDAVWGGETGGEILTKHLRPQTATIYADSMLPKLQAKYGLVRDEKGEIEILKRFWKFGEVNNVAPPLVVYADLLATANERNIETAQIIYDKYLAPIAEEDSR